MKLTTPNGCFLTEAAMHEELSSAVDLSGASLVKEMAHTRPFYAYASGEGRLKT
jgi:hypothetical protein